MKLNAAHPFGVGVGSYKMKPPSPPNIEIKKKHIYIGMMLSNVLCDLHFSQPQPMKLADD